MGARSSTQYKLEQALDEITIELATVNEEERVLVASGKKNPSNESIAKQILTCRRRKKQLIERKQQLEQVVANQQLYAHQKLICKTLKDSSHSPTNILTTDINTYQQHVKQLQDNQQQLTRHLQLTVNVDEQDQEENNIQIIKNELQSTHVSTPRPSSSITNNNNTPPISKEQVLYERYRQLIHTQPLPIIITK